MVDETIRSIKEAEQQAEEILVKAQEQKEQILKDASLQAKQIHEELIEEAKRTAGGLDEKAREEAKNHHAIQAGYDAERLQQPQGCRRRCFYPGAARCLRRRYGRAERPRRVCAYCLCWRLQAGHLR